MYILGFLGGVWEVKDPSAMQDTWVQCLSREDPKEEQRATHSSIAWRTPQKEESGKLQSIATVRRVEHHRSNWARTHAIYVFQYYSLSSHLFCNLLHPQV